MQLEDLIINHDLEARPSRPPEFALDKLVAHALALEIPNGAQSILTAACSFALDFCGAESSAISLRVDEDALGEPMWVSVAGRMKHHLGGSAESAEPRAAIVLHVYESLLLREPDRYFTWMRVPGMHVIEALVTPIYDGHRHPQGSLWTMRHDPGHLFDEEDVRIQSMLALRATAALELRRRIDLDRKLH